MIRSTFTRVCSGTARRILTSHHTYCVRRAREFKSLYSLDKIYPNSKQDYGTVESEFKDKISLPKENTEEPFSGFIPIEKLEIKYIRGSGPGGQNVNKVDTKVEVRFHVASAEWIPKWLRDKLIIREHNSINKEGFLIVTSDRTRKQLLNQADCMDKLRTMIHLAAHKPRGLNEDEKLLMTTRIAKAQFQTVRVKRQHSLKKQSRSPPGMGDI